MRTLLLDDDQAELALTRSPDRIVVPIEMIRAKKNSGAAFTLASEASGLDDKEIYLAVGIDAGYFSNIKKGKATLQADLMARFCEVVGNVVYPRWLAYQVGYGLMLLKTEAERRAEIAEARAEALDAENRLMRQLIQGKAA